MNTREQLAALEASMHAGDELMARLVEQLKEHAALADELEHMERYRSVMRSAAASFIVEAACILRDDGSRKVRDALFGRTTAPVWHQ